RRGLRRAEITGSRRPVAVTVAEEMDWAVTRVRGSPTCAAATPERHRRASMGKVVRAFMGGSLSQERRRARWRGPARWMAWWMAWWRPARALRAAWQPGIRTR